MLKRFRDGAVFGAPEEARAKIMSQVASKLTDADIEALASTLQGLGSANP
jgi:cytochrome c553